MLAVALDMAHEAGDRRVHRERDLAAPGELPELLRPRVVHPEPGLEVDLVRRVAALAQELDRRLGRFPRQHPCRPKAEHSHGCNVTQPCCPIGVLRFFAWPSAQLESTFWSSTSTSASPISGGRPVTSRTGISTSSPHSCGPRTARGTATP